MNESEKAMYDALQQENLQLKEKINEVQLQFSQVRQFMNDMDDLFEKIREVI
jgi:hypothetical protein